MARLLATVRRRIVRLVKRHGIDLERPSDEVDPADERLFESLVYAEIQGASVTGRVANDGLGHLEHAGGSHHPRHAETVECMRRPIQNHSGKDDAVYDPFSGNGTTIVACEQRGRRCYAMELLP